MGEGGNMYIKKAKPEDTDKIAEVEAACFPEKEAASAERIAERVRTYPEGFWLGFDDFRQLICYVGGPVTMEKDLTDEMYADPSCHTADGDWQMIFSVCTLPDHRHQGLGTWILNRAIREARSKERKGVVLTCKEPMISFYERFGFVNEGLSESEHGGAPWYQMRLVFDEEYDLVHQFDVSDIPEENMRMFNSVFWGGGVDI